MTFNSINKKVVALFSLVTLFLTGNWLNAQEKISLKTPMPPMPQVPAADAKKIAIWINSLQTKK